MIEAPGNDAGRAKLADWAELYLILSDLAAVTDSQMARQTGALEELEHEVLRDEYGEDFEEEILETANEATRSALWDELSLRQQILGERYPYDLTAAGAGWKLRRRMGGSIELRRARWIYLATLVMSGFRYGFITKDSGDPVTWDDLKKAIPDHLQAIAVFAAASLFDEVYWFGWPRPDSSGFTTALGDLRDKMGLGVLRDPPTTATVNVKDATVDLVAWRGFADSMYGALVMYGQVASGSRWEEKSTNNHINGKFLQHFTDHPSKGFLTSTFIPFVGHEQINFDRPTSELRLRTDKARELDRDHGIVVDRLRLAELISEGLRDRSKIHNCPDPDQALVGLIRWLRDCRAYCQPAA